VLIPEDDYPSASQAGVVDFIDFQLATDYGVGNGMYMQAPFFEGASQQGYQFPYPPSELFRRAIAALREEGETISDLNEAGRRDAVRRLSEREDMLTEDISATGFFDELWKLTNEGYFSDPIYLGNRDYAGWEMVGFPGAHAYYLHSVDAHNRPYPAPPMGIAHDPARRSTLPRLVGREG
jgi:gluconate 2-dehydrogenase alpha chain/gluconate 2-dehydrogenase gamma chain